MSQTHSDIISIHEIYKIDHIDPDEPIQMRLLAELTTAEQTLDFLAPKLRGNRRRNFFGKALKTAVLLKHDTLNEAGRKESECDEKCSYRPPRLQ